MKRTAFILLACASLFSCGEKHRTIEIDTSKSNVKEVVIERFDREFFQMDTSKIESSLSHLKEKYGQFSDLYLKGVIGSNPLTPEGEIVRAFLTHPAYRELYNDCERLYQDLGQEEKAMTEAFKRLNALYPNMTVPKVYAVFSGFGNFITTAENTLAISLEYYLGKDYKNYQYVEGIYDYLIANLRREKMASDAVKGWVETEFTLNEETPNLLASIIHQGKLMYLMENLFPETDEKELMGYTQGQWEWCEANEAQMWGFLTDNQQLFSTDQILIAKYTTPSPFTSFFPQESPGRTGVWIGWQIVRSFMTKQNETTLQELMATNNAQTILQKSGYRPK